VANFTVVYDACGFYPAPLRDLMVRLAQNRRFQACEIDHLTRKTDLPESDFLSPLTD